MEFFLGAFGKAFSLLASLDPELYGTIGRSLFVSSFATLISAAIAIPAGIYISLHRFPGKNIVITVLNTFMGLPPVVVGLFVYMLLSNQMGIFGAWRLLFSATAMIIAQVLLGTPIIAALTVVAVEGIDPLLKQTAVSLGASSRHLFLLMGREARYAIGAAIIAGFGRLIAEVGAVMMVGGNIRFQTRVMTTAIAMQKGMGEFEMALALGIILILLSFVITFLLDKIRSGEGRLLQ